MSNDLKLLQRYETRINVLKSELEKLYKRKKNLQDKISFYSFVEGDVCGAKEGEEVVILQKGGLEGKRGKVHSKDTGAVFYREKSRRFTVYEVIFPDNSVLTFDHTVLKRVESEKI